MTKRYHVNPHTGDPGECSARISCPYGNLETDHFNSKEDARAAYEAGQLDNAFSTLSKALDETVDSYFQDEDPGYPYNGTLTDETMAEMDEYFSNRPGRENVPREDSAPFIDDTAEPPF